LAQAVAAEERVWLCETGVEAWLWAVDSFHECYGCKSCIEHWTCKNWTNPSNYWHEGKYTWDYHYHYYTCSKKSCKELFWYSMVWNASSKLEKTSYRWWLYWI